MAVHRSSAARVPVTVLVTLAIVVGEFAFLMAVFHLGDRVARQHVAQARVAGTLSAWRPGAATTPVDGAVRALAATRPAGVQGLVRAADAWASAPGDAARLDRLRSADARLGDRIEGRERAVDTRVATILATLLVLVSVGWFAWFRKLVRRHRRLQQAVTEKQTFDEGERRLLALVRGSVDLVAVLEPDTTATFVSPSSASVLGRSPEELTGRRLVELVAEADVPVLVDLMSGSREGEQSVVLHAARPDGRGLVLEGTLNNLLADPAVRGWVLTVRDVTHRDSLQAQLTHLGFHDALTGLANRQLFADRLGHALRSRDRAVEPLAVLVVDLDDFQQLNDSAGHAAGDEVLVTTARLLTEVVRQGDTAARLGADEFAVLMENADADAARRTADRLLGALQGADVAGTPSVTGASIGIASARPGESDPEETLRHANVAMHWAKDRGKGQVALYDPQLHADALERLALRGELQQALREDQLVLHYQPTVDLASGRTTGFEALVRWQHPTRGLLLPADFLPVAAESGLVVPMGSWVLEESCRAAASLQSVGRHPHVGVNVVAQQLAAPGFVEEVLGALAAADLPAERLVLEITETALLDDLDVAAATLTRLREAGLRVAIDDFGTGYSSLSYLSSLPVDILKVDKSFVDGVHLQGGQTSVVESVVSLAHRLGLVTVAEGVEHEAQARWLQAAGCSFGQGFWWSRAVPLEQARALVAGPPWPIPAPLTTARTA